MFYIAISLVLVIIGIALLWISWQRSRPEFRWAAWTTWGLAVLSVASTCYTVVDQDSVGHLKGIYLSKSMQPGQIIAFEGENGPQARILGPGSHLIPFIDLFYEVEDLPLVEVPQGQYGLLVAKDGEPLKPEQFMAKSWSRDEFNQMLDAEYFLRHGGQKGPQLTVLKPGKYRLNRYLFEVKLHDALDVAAGEVAVIKSNVQEIESCPVLENLAEERSVRVSGSAMSVPIVPKGCIGVWHQPLLPGRYYLNREAYAPTLIQTRAQTWMYLGGYEKRRIDLTVSDDGKIQQEAKTVVAHQPKGATGPATVVTMEGWRVPLDVRVVVQVDPADAPRVVASVGGLPQVADRIVTPALRSTVRNVLGAPERKVLDLINERERLEALVEERLYPEGAKAGVTIKEVRFGDPSIPPELLVARQRQQLADQLEVTYERERVAQEKRIAVEKSRAMADQQSELVRAQIAVQVAKHQRERLRLQGEGEKLRLIEIAAGQKTQTEILGKDRVYQLAVFDKVLEAAIQNPNIVKIPQVYVQGESRGFEGPAAILGASNLIRSLQGGAARVPTGNVPVPVTYPSE